MVTLKRLTSSRPAKNTMSSGVKLRLAGKGIPMDPYELFALAVQYMKSPQLSDLWRNLRTIFLDVARCTFVQFFYLATLKKSHSQLDLYSYVSSALVIPLGTFVYCLKKRNFKLNKYTASGRNELKNNKKTNYKLTPQIHWKSWHAIKWLKIPKSWLL